MSRVLSAFLDEAGKERRYGPRDRWYLLTLALHDQDDDISRALAAYEDYIARRGLPDIAFHMVDLMHGHRDYEGIGLTERKRLLMSFNSFVQRLPVTYHTFAYRRSEFAGHAELSARMRRDLVAFMEERLADLQSYDTIAVYYDGGQSSVSRAVHGAFDYMLSANVAEYRRLRYQDRRLAQVADYLCSVELAELRYAGGEVSNTYRKVFGTHRAFRANYLKQARRKLA